MACADIIVPASNMKGDFLSAGFQLFFFLLSPDIAQKSQIFHAEMLFFSPKLSPTHEKIISSTRELASATVQASMPHNRHKINAILP